MSAAPSAEMTPTASSSVCAAGGRVEQRPRAGDEVDAGSNHRRRVDERRDRRRALHRVGQPDVQRELRRLADRADGDEHGRSGDGRGRKRAELLHDLLVAERAGYQPTAPRCPSSSPTSPTRVVRNALIAAADGGRLLVPEADEQVRARAHELPADEQRRERVADDQQRHRAREQRTAARSSEPNRGPRPCSPPRRP